MRRAFIAAALVLGAASPLAAQPVSKDGPSGGGGWTSLSSLQAWRGYKQESVPAEWTQESATTFGKTKGTEDLVSKNQYGDFDLELDWKLSPGGNAGIFYHATEEGDKVYWTGPEYQLLDNARHPDGKNPLTSAGSIYAVYPPAKKVVKPAGE